MYLLFVMCRESHWCCMRKGCETQKELRSENRSDQHQIFETESKGEVGEVVGVEINSVV